MTYGNRSKRQRRFAKNPLAIIATIVGILLLVFPTIAFAAPRNPVKSVLLSVRPHFAEALLEGSKTADVRRRFPTLHAGTRIYIYSSSHVGAVLGTVDLETVDRDDVCKLWSRHRDRIGISKDDFLNYIEGVRKPAVLIVENPRCWKGAMPRSILQEVLGLKPPQSFRYLNESQCEGMECWEWMQGQLERCREFYKHHLAFQKRLAAKLTEPPSCVDVG